MVTVCFTGHLSSDIVLSETKAGNSLVFFTMAATNGFNENECKMYFQCFLYSAEAERFSKLDVKKGSQLAINGKYYFEEFYRYKKNISAAA